MASSSESGGLLPFDPSQLRCDGCGGIDIGHFVETLTDGTQRDRNRCHECGLESEYIPTQAEIAVQCEALRHEHFEEMRLMDWSPEEDQAV